MSKAMDGFPTTHWSLILDKDKRKECLKELAENYDAAIFNIAKNIFRLKDEDARELTQQVFESIIVDNVLDKVNRERGKLRCYLISIIRNKAFHFFYEGKQIKIKKETKKIKKFSELSDQIRNNFLDIEDPSALQEEELQSRMQAAFNQEWVLVIREKSLNQLEQYCGSKDKAKKALECFKQNFFQNRKPAEIARDLGCDPRWVSDKIYRLKIKYAEFFEHIVRETVADEDSLKEELRELR
ncbi:MAG: sigma-70 family RNA polymerase sigma factor [Candidatus Brocadiae bacterium]|nr:sigma-70 family RNA polymerase sigma factor [Candidatus Brocadiia bacterium]